MSEKILMLLCWKQFSRTASPMDDRVSSPSGQQPNQTMVLEKPYKPKFHNASLYTKDEQQQQQHTKQMQLLQQRQPQLSSVPVILPAQFSPVPSTSIASNIIHPLVSYRYHNVNATRINNDITIIWCLFSPHRMSSISASISPKLSRKTRPSWRVLHQLCKRSTTKLLASHVDM